MRLRRRFLLGPVLAGLVATSLVACGSGAAPVAGSRGTDAIPAENAAHAVLLPDRADALPDFSLTRYRSLLRELRGTPVVVTMWGSWCAPCATDAPMLEHAHSAYGDRVQFLGIDIEDSIASARAFISRFGWTFPSIRDPDIPSSFRSGLGFAGQPNTLFYAASGELVTTWQGPLTQDALDAGLRRIAPVGRSG